jgi:hypothetical protein
MDRNGNFYYANAAQIPSAEWLRLSLQQSLFKYLEYITSGRAGTSGAVPPFFEGSGHETVQRQESERQRHQWRIMKSTPQNRITLHSPQAQEHKEFIRINYGIDIYQENLRRWRNRSLKRPKSLNFTLAPDQLLSEWESGKLMSPYRDPINEASEEVFEILTFVRGIENPNAPPYEHIYEPQANENF